MNRIKWVGMLFLVCFLPAHAFSTVDEQIDSYLGILTSGPRPMKITMLKRLQWSGLTDARLYDEVEKQLLAGHTESEWDTPSQELLFHQALALGYSGNDKYRETLDRVSSKAAGQKLRNHAKQAIKQLEDFTRWNRLIAQSNFSIDGKSVDVVTYMKMLNTDDIMVQRLAARAIFHEQRRDPELLALAAEKLEAMYAQVGLNGHAQDATAWLCKAIGQSGRLKYGELLSEVVQKTPYEKIRKHAKRYAFLPYSSGTETASLESQPITNYKVAGTYASKITSGFWTLNLKSSTPKIKIQQTGNNVNGTYGKGSGNFDGVIVGNTITIEWYTVRGSGKGTLKINPENNQLVGSFGNSKWNLKKIE